jgi:hypothetical protein
MANSEIPSAPFLNFHLSLFTLVLVFVVLNPAVTFVEILFVVHVDHGKLKYELISIPTLPPPH